MCGSSSVAKTNARIRATTFFKEGTLTIVDVRRAALEAKLASLDRAIGLQVDKIVETAIKAGTADPLVADLNLAADLQAELVSLDD